MQSDRARLGRDCYAQDRDRMPDNLDLVSIFQSDGSDPTGQVEAMDIFNVLETNGVAAVLVGDVRLPNLPFGVRVAREDVKRSRQLIAEAQSVGPAGAEEAELESEEKAGGV